MTTAARLPPNVLPSTAWAGAFTTQELDAIERYGDTLAKQKVTVEDPAHMDEYGSLRISHTAWMEQDAVNAWIYERITKVAQALNAKAYQFDLRGFSDKFNYTVYHATEGGHCDWHVDLDAHDPPRKLSLSVQLSDPADYQGGELQLYGSNKIETAPKARGTVIAFPSYVLHRVTPVTKGTRKAIIAWCSGPRLR